MSMDVVFITFNMRFLRSTPNIIKPNVIKLHIVILVIVCGYL